MTAAGGSADGPQRIPLPHCCLWWYAPLDRPRRAFTDLGDWESHAISHQAFKSL